MSSDVEPEVLIVEIRPGEAEEDDVIMMDALGRPMPIIPAAIRPRAQRALSAQPRGVIEITSDSSSSSSDADDDGVEIMSPLQKRSEYAASRHTLEAAVFAMASPERQSIDALKSQMRCALCLEAFEDMTSTSCGHVYCRVCITEAISKVHKCPLCHVKLGKKDIHPLYL
jgi:hypothetical protein